MEVNCYQRDQGWQVHQYQAGDQGSLNSIGLEFRIELLYQGVQV
jgi:hypothetical protein